MLRLPNVRWALVAAVLLGLMCALVRLLSVPGVESAFVLGLVLPPFIAAAAAQLVWRERDAPTERSASRMLGRVFALALLVVGLPTLMLVANGLRTRLCDPVLGLSFIALGPLSGAALAASIGALAGSLPVTERRAVGLALLGPFIAVAVGIFGFYATPAIFVYSPFAGYFPGTIYDRQVGIPTAYLTYRAGSAVALLGVSLLFGALWDRASGRARPRAMRAHTGVLAASVACFAGMIALFVAGPSLGHRASASHTARVLGARVETDRCVLHMPRETPARLRRLYGVDCDYHVERIEAALGVRHPAKVSAYFYRSSDEKRALMGAAHTQIAKPWRAEVHVQISSWPHPVLGHELVHVLGAKTGAGPFAISGSLYGLIPNPGLIEGLAVGTAWDRREGLDPDQWARTMLELGELPRLRDVFGLSFTALPPRKAYDTAGSFFRYVREQRGPEAVRRVYLQGDIETALGEPLDALEREWRGYLSTVALPDGAVERARARFADHSVFSAVCPHEVAALHGELAADLAAGDDERAVRTSCAILDVDPADLHSAVHRVGALARLGRADEAASAVEDLASAGFPASTIATARLTQADGAFLAGDLARAKETYLELLGASLDEELLRAIDVRLLALASPDDERELIAQILLGYDGQPLASSVVVHLARTLGVLRTDGLAPYLEARQLYFASRFDRAAVLLGRADAQGLPSAHLRREATRMRLRALAAVGRYAEADAALAALAADPAARAEADEWRARLAFMRGAQPEA